jgi:hypothetical protein
MRREVACLAYHTSDAKARAKILDFVPKPKKRNLNLQIVFSGYSNEAAIIESDKNWTSIVALLS